MTKPPSNSFLLHQFLSRTAWALTVGAVMLGATGCQDKASVESTESAKPESGKQAEDGKHAYAAKLQEDSAPHAKPAKRQSPVALPRFMDAALQGDLETVRQALATGTDANATDQQSRTALMFAAFNGNTAIVKLLLAHGAKVSQRDAEGRTALLFAATSPSANTVEALLDAGAEINVVDSGEKFTALMHASAEGQVETVKLLLKRGANAELRDIDGDTAKDFAVQKGHAEVVELLEK